jgi:hypothetical protein
MRRIDAQRWPGPYNRLFDELPFEVDWELLEAEHAERPFTSWARLMLRPQTPEEVLRRHTALLPPADDLALLDGPAHVLRARSTRGFGELGDGLVAHLLDHALDAGLLDGADLLIRTAPAARVLMYLSGAVERDDLPHAARVALATLAEQVPLILGADPVLWARLAPVDARSGGVVVSAGQTEAWRGSR